MPWPERRRPLAAKAAILDARRAKRSVQRFARLFAPIDINVICSALFPPRIRRLHDPVRRRFKPQTLGNPACMHEKEEAASVSEQLLQRSQLRRYFALEMAY